VSIRVVQFPSEYTKREKKEEGCRGREKKPGKKDKNNGGVVSAGRGGGEKLKTR